VAEGMVELFREKLGIKESLTYKDIERAYENPEVALIIHAAHQLSNKPVADKEKNFSIDGTGLPESSKQNYANDRDSKTKCKEIKGYEKLIAVFGNNYKLIGACGIADANDNECPYLKPLLDELMKVYKELGLLQADSAYLSRDNCDAIVSYGGTPRIYPKSNTVINQRGSKSWTQMLLAFITNPQKWLEEYHSRSISESSNSVIKRRFPRNLLKRDVTRRKLEAFLRACIYNLRQLNYIHYLCPEVNVIWLK
jgi:transposase